MKRQLLILLLVVTAFAIDQQTDNRIKALERSIGKIPVMLSEPNKANLQPGGMALYTVPATYAHRLYIHYGDSVKYFDINDVTSITAALALKQDDADTSSTDATRYWTSIYYGKKNSIRYREHYASLDLAICDGDSIPDSGIIYGWPAHTDTIQPRSYSAWSYNWPIVDDELDNSLENNAAINVASGTHIIFPEDYVLYVRKPKTLDMNYSNIGYIVFLLKNVDNVTIEGGTIICEPFDDDSTTWTEGDHIFGIFNSSNVTIRNMNLINPGADVVDIGRTSKNILFENCNFQMKNLTAARNSTASCHFSSDLSWYVDGFGTITNWAGSNATASLSTTQKCVGGYFAGSYSMKVTQTGANGYAYSEVSFTATDYYKFSFYVYAATGHGSGDPKIYIGTSPGASDIETLTFDGRDYWQLKTSHYMQKGVSDKIYISFCPSAGDNNAEAYLDEVAGQDKELIGRHCISIDPNEKNKVSNVTFRSCVSRANGRGTCDLETYNGYGAVIENITFDDFKFKPVYDELLTNGNFDSDLSSWTQTGWTWEDGAARCAAGASTLTQTFSADSGTVYQFGCTFSDKTTGYIWVGVPGLDTVGVEFSGKYGSWGMAKTTGTYTFTIWPWGGSGFNGKIDNCYVRKITTSGGSGLQMQIADGDSLRNLRFINCEFDSLSNWAIYSNAGNSDGYKNISFENCSFTNNNIALFTNLMRSMTVNNCKFINNKRAFHTDGSMIDVSFTNNLFQDNYDWGMVFYNSGDETYQNISIIGNTFDGNEDALRLTGLNGFVCKDNILINNTKGLEVNSSTTNGIIENNRSSGNTTDVSYISSAVNTVYGANKMDMDGRQVIGASFEGTDPGSLDAIMTESQIVFPGYRDSFGSTVTAGAKVAAVKRASWGAAPYNSFQTCDLTFSTLGTLPGDADDTVQRMRISNVGNVRIGSETERPDYDVEITNRTVDSDDEATSLRLGAHWIGTTASANEQVTSRNEILSSGYRDIRDNTISAKMSMRNLSKGGAGWGYNAVQYGDIYWYTLNQMPTDIDDTTLKMGLTYDGRLAVGLTDPYTAKSLITSENGIRGDTLVAEIEVKTDTIRSDNDIKFKGTGYFKFERTGSYSSNDLVFLTNSSTAPKIAIVGNKNELYYWDSSGGGYGTIHAGLFKSQSILGGSGVDSVNADKLDGYHSAAFQAVTDTSSKDATRYWVSQQGYLTSETGDISAVNVSAPISGGGSSGAVTISADTSSGGAKLATQYFVTSKGYLTSETGDIAGVTAGWGLSGGGTSGTVTVTADTAAGKLATAYDLTGKVSMTGNETIAGEKTFSSMIKSGVTAPGNGIDLQGNSIIGLRDIWHDETTGRDFYIVNMDTAKKIIFRVKDASGNNLDILDLDGNGQVIEAHKQITSDVTSGTAPFTVASNTVVTNLNADLLDGQHSSAFLTSETGDISAVNVNAPITGGGASGAVTISADTSAGAAHLATQYFVTSKGYLTAETGDISAVTAGWGISGGGTSGAVTVTVDTAAGKVATKYDLTSKVGKTGNETIAGVKTFSDTMKFSASPGTNALNMGDNYVANTRGIRFAGTTGSLINSTDNSSIDVWVKKSGKSLAQSFIFNGADEKNTSLFPLEIMSGMRFVGAQSSTYVANVYDVWVNGDSLLYKSGVSTTKYWIISGTLVDKH